MPRRKISRTSEPKAPATAQKNTSKKSFSFKMKSAARIMADEHLTFKLLNACMYVDLRDVTINPYDYMVSASPSSLKEGRSSSTAFPNDSDSDFYHKAPRKIESVPTPAKGRRETLRKNQNVTINLESDEDDDEKATGKLRTEKTVNETIQKNKEIQSTDVPVKNMRASRTRTVSATKAGNTKTPTPRRTTRASTPFTDITSNNKSKNKGRIQDHHEALESEGNLNVSRSTRKTTRQTPVSEVVPSRKNKRSNRKKIQTNDDLSDTEDDSVLHKDMNGSKTSLRRKKDSSKMPNKLNDSTRTSPRKKTDALSEKKSQEKQLTQRMLIYSDTSDDQDTVSNESVQKLSTRKPPILKDQSKKTKAKSDHEGDSEKEEMCKSIKSKVQSEDDCDSEQQSDVDVETVDQIADMSLKEQSIESEALNDNDIDSEESDTEVASPKKADVSKILSTKKQFSSKEQSKKSKAQSENENDSEQISDVDVETIESPKIADVSKLSTEKQSTSKEQSQKSRAQTVVVSDSEISDNEGVKDVSSKKFLCKKQSTSKKSMAQTVGDSDSEKISDDEDDFNSPKNVDLNNSMSTKKHSDDESNSENKSDDKVDTVESPPKKANISMKFTKKQFTLKKQSKESDIHSDDHSHSENTSDIEVDIFEPHKTSKFSNKDQNMLEDKKSVTSSDDNDSGKMSDVEFQVHSENESEKEIENDQEIEKINKNVMEVDEPESEGNRNIVSNGVSSTQELIDILAETEVPEATDDAPFKADDTLNLSATSHSSRISPKTIEKLEASKKLAAESIKLMRDLAGETTDSESQDEKQFKSAATNDSEDTADKENIERNDINDTMLTSSMKKKTNNKRHSFKIRFSKGFQYSKHNCSMCQKVFSKKVDLEFHCLQHMDGRHVSVRVFRTILPSSYDTSKNDMEKYLRPRKKRPASQIDLGLVKNLVSKYCKDDSFLEPFDNLIEGDISSQDANGESSSNENENADKSPGVKFNVISDITIIHGCKPDHSVEIDADQLEAVLVENDEETPKSPSTLVVEANKEASQVVADSQVVVCGDTQNDGGDVPDSEALQLDSEIVAFEKFAAHSMVSGTDVEEDTISETQNDEVVPETQEEECAVVETGIEVIPETQQDECGSRGDADTQVVEHRVLSATDSEVVSETVEVDDGDLFEADTEGEDVSEPDQIGETQNNESEETDDTVIDLHDEDPVELEEEKLNLNDSDDEEDLKKRKRDSSDVDLGADRANKKTKIVEESDSDDFLSCVNALSPNMLTDDEDDIRTAEVPSSQFSDTSENEHPEYLSKLATLDNQLKTIIDRNKKSIDVYEDLDSTITEAENIVKSTSGTEEDAIFQ